MTGTVTQYMKGMPNWASYGLLILLRGLADRFSSQCLSTAGLVINAVASPLAKAGSAFQYYAKGVLVAKAANTAMAALSGTVANATHNVFVFYGDRVGTLTTLMGQAGSSLSRVKFPNTPEGRAIVGYVYINPTGTGPFVGGTTPLDDATVVPNAVYVNTPYPFDPTILP